MAEISVLYPTLKAREPLISHQLPPPPPTPPLASSSSSVTSVPILAISILGILTTCILLVSYYVFVIKCCLSWRHPDVISRLYDSRSRRHRWRQADPSAPAAGRRGLEEKVIRAIPIFRFGGFPGEQKLGSLQECAVCLNEFEEGECLRRLPRCSHAFHIDCIDVWLQSSANCPLCRADVTGAAAAILPTEQGLPPGAHLLQDTSHRGSGVVIEVRDVDGGDGVGGLTPRREASMQQPVMGAAQWQATPRKAADQGMGQHKVRRKLRGAACSMGDEWIDVWRGKDEEFSVVPMRRSFSMDSSSHRQLYMSIQEVLLHNPHFYSPQEGGSSSSSVTLAGRVRRSFFSFGRSSRRVVLPMASGP